MGTSPYTPERLDEAAASSRTLSETLTKLGVVDPKGGSRRYIRERMRKLGISTAHFEREGVRWTREVLEPAVAASTSVCEVLRRLGIDVVGGHHTNISRRITAYGIDTSHFGPPAHTERMRNNRRRRAPENILREDHSAHAQRVPGAHLKRALLELGISERCELCGIGATWQGHPLPLEVDHIDGNWRDNRAENLRLLCPNCHSTTDTYRGRSKGGRASAK